MISVIDFLVHGGHQYEFFKNDARFSCTKPDGSLPAPGDLGRPKNHNVKYIRICDIGYQKFDIFMYRQNIKDRFYKEILNRSPKARGIAVVQTYQPSTQSYQDTIASKYISAVVWNSKTVMDRHYRKFQNKKHFYIPHGFDSNEFTNLNLPRIPKVLSSFSLFKQRGGLLGYPEWEWVSQELGGIDLLGHGNEGIKTNIGSFSMEQLVKKYNTYSVYLNTTIDSAMPRSRAEALMCGTPIVTTKNYDIEKYLIHGKSCLFADSKEEMLISCNRILQSSSLMEDLSAAGREAAIEHFNIKTYIQRWKEVFEEVMR